MLLAHSPAQSSNKQRSSSVSKRGCLMLTTESMAMTTARRGGGDQTRHPWVTISLQIGHQMPYMESMRLHVQLQNLLKQWTTFLQTP